MSNRVKRRQVISPAGSPASSSSTSSATNSMAMHTALWDCSVCTYSNAREAFKCRMCDTRKGTSTRKPRLNAQVVEVQQHIQAAIVNAARGASAGVGSLEVLSAPDLSDQEDGVSDAKKARKSKIKKAPRIVGPRSIEEDSYSTTSSVASLDKIASDKQDSTTSSLAAASTKVKAARRYSSQPPKLRNVDRSSACDIPVTVNGVTVIFTEFKPRPRKSLLSKASAASATSIGATQEEGSIEVSQAAAASFLLTESGDEKVSKAQSATFSSTDSTRSLSPANATNSSSGVTGSAGASTDLVQTVMRDADT